jgi:ribosomal protein S18 acetylase RimI-like enzyme
MEIRFLRGSDAAAYREVRLRALREDPDSFLASAEEEEAVTVEENAQRLEAGDMLGAFVEGRLVGTALVRREKRRKGAHIANLYAFWVAPEVRRRGIGSALVRRAIDEAVKLGAEQLQLGVSETALAARRLYERAGFRVVATLPRAIKDGDRHLDEHLMMRMLP